MKNRNLFIGLLALFISRCTCHFLLNYPATIGFDDDSEGMAPCGNFEVNFTTNNVTEFHVGGDSISLTSFHPQGNWLFRATLDTTATGNWTNLLPVVGEVGLGDFCESNLTVPESWAGSKGVISIIQDAADGLLYQCAAVNFVTGSIMPPAVCKNVTGLTAAFTSDAALSSVPTTATASTTSSTASSSSSSSSTSKSSASAIHFSYTGGYSIIWAIVVGAASDLLYLL